MRAAAVVVAPVVGERVRTLAGDVLDERAAEGDVEQLDPAADREHRAPVRARGIEQRDLGLVALDADVGDGRVARGAVAGGVHILAAGEEQGVRRVDDASGVVGALERRHEDREAAGLLDGARVRQARGARAACRASVRSGAVMATIGGMQGRSTGLTLARAVRPDILHHNLTPATEEPECRRTNSIAGKCDASVLDPGAHRRFRAHQGDVPEVQERRRGARAERLLRAHAAEVLTHDGRAGVFEHLKQSLRDALAGGSTPAVGGADARRARGGEGRRRRSRARRATARRRSWRASARSWRRCAAAANSRRRSTTPRRCAVAARYEKKHAERVEMLERKLAALETEVALGERELEEMSAQFKEMAASARAPSAPSAPAAQAGLDDRDTEHNALRREAERAARAADADRAPRGAEEADGPLGLHARGEPLEQRHAEQHRRRRAEGRSRRRS